MKVTSVVTSLALLSLFAGAAHAQTESLLNGLKGTLSECATQCIVAALPVSGCDLKDTTCFCTNNAFAVSLGTCLMSNCTLDDTAQLQTLQSTVCSTGDDDETSLIRGLCWTFFALAVVSVAIRTASRFFVFADSSFGPDDAAIAVTLCILAGNMGLLETLISKGLGKPISQITATVAEDILYYSYISAFLYTTVTVLIKHSMLFLYMRIFPASSSKKLYTSCWILIAILTAYLLSFLLGLGLICRPITMVWDSSIPGTCGNAEKLLEIATGLNIAFDIILIVLPVANLLRLNMSMHAKAGIVVVFMTGFFITAASIIRLVYLYQLEHKTGNLWASYTHLTIWSYTECSVGICCACMPTMAGPIRLFWRKTVGSSQRSKPSVRESYHENMALRRLPSSGFAGGDKKFVAKDSKRTTSTSSLIVEDMK